ncbi:MAG: carbamoyltransferase HypF [Desulfuromonas sp.]|nr:MAG: carbamoyltransferase HypF [Desulfuromonas sp.]
MSRTPASKSDRLRRRIDIEGIVQGVGFRPFVYQAALRNGMVGFVLNNPRGVRIEAEGAPHLVEAFVEVLRTEYPPLAFISRFSVDDLEPARDTEFCIRSSEHDAEVKAQIAPDASMCDDCRAELFDPNDRRFRYPFINCTNCGPRYTIVTGVPYDRPLTTMADFPMCPACRAEYEDPLSRRFHAQPNACPECGPQLRLVDPSGRGLGNDPLAETIRLLQEGKVVAIKGLGGYHLAVDASNEDAVQTLRRRKGRDEKPFALMVRDLESADRLVRVDDKERRLLLGIERPIVLLEQRIGNLVAPSVAPGNRYLGIMLPYTPLHDLLLAESFAALVMTSANFSDEPIAFEDEDARERLTGIADAFLQHNRRIHTRTDDSIARVMGGEALLLRRSRGYTPRSIFLPAVQPQVLALGAELKSTVCLTQDDRAYLSQHIGDLKNLETDQAFTGVIDHLKTIFELQPEIIAHDLHPDYASSRFAETIIDRPKIAVQHHHAHLASCLAEHGETGPAIGVIFDGIGYGQDGTIWGGEFLLGDLASYQRVGHLKQVPLPGGDASTREPWRMALSYLDLAFAGDIPDLPFLFGREPADVNLLQKMIRKKINSPLTSSCGRLFDAVAALAGVRQCVNYEGQAALELEMSIPTSPGDDNYDFSLESGDEVLLLDPSPVFRAVAEDSRRGVAPGLISSRFHIGLAEAVRMVCEELRSVHKLDCVVLSGGVFQNRFLTERVSQLLGKSNFRVIRHSLVPPNDGGIALGQAVIAGRVG